MSGNGSMNDRIRQAMTPKHDLETFVGFLPGHNLPQDATEATQPAQEPPDRSQAPPKPSRRRVNADAGEGTGPDSHPDAGTSGHQVMNRLLKDAIRGKDRA